MIEPSAYGGDAPYVKPESRTMPNVMAAKPNILDALCESP